MMFSPSPPCISLCFFLEEECTIRIWKVTSNVDPTTEFCTFRTLRAAVLGQIKCESSSPTAAQSKLLLAMQLEDTMAAILG